MMRERIRIFISLVLFWLAFMVVARAAFMLYNADMTSALSPGEIFRAMAHGIRMDASISGYFLAASGLLLAMSSLTTSRAPLRLISHLSIFLLIICCIVVSVDLELYRHWGFRMNTTPLMYVGSEAMGSVQPWVYAKLTLIFSGLLLLFLFAFRRIIAPHLASANPPRRKGVSAAALFTLAALTFLPIRGSFTVAPMNTGFVYFHNSKPYANHSAVNVVWNFLYSVKKGSSSDYPENFFDRQKTEQYFRSLYQATGPTTKILNGPKPNIILVILESFTADVVEPLGGLPEVSPHLNQLCHEGVLFTDIYSSGDRTDKGLISILSGYPAQPQGSIIKLPAKTERLPQLNRYLRDLGYRTSFLYGGDIDFANFRSYLNSGGFHHLTTLDDFDPSLYTSKWGVHDHHMFAQAKSELDTAAGPFFKVILTLSSHEPFDVPLSPKFREGNDEESMFVNSCHYTDRTLGDFVAYCKSKSWWSNTLMIITADHGHRYPRNKELIEKKRFHVPLLFTGGAVTKDTVISTVGSQTDIANTLLGQLDRQRREFVFSKNLLNPSSKSFAAYFFTDGYGFILPDEFIVYDNAGKQFIKEGQSEQSRELSKAYQQKLFSNYNQLDR